MPVSEGLEHPELPDGTGEFLDAWLMLVEKMVNPATVLDSPHALPAKVPGSGPVAPQFSALRFLIVTQKVGMISVASCQGFFPRPFEYRSAILYLISKFKIHLAAVFDLAE